MSTFEETGRQSKKPGVVVAGRAVVDKATPSSTPCTVVTAWNAESLFLPSDDESPSWEISSVLDFQTELELFELSSHSPLELECSEAGTQFPLYVSPGSPKDSWVINYCMY